MLSSSLEFVEYELFDGAIKCLWPANLMDASAFRQVPDTEEVYLSHDTDISFTVEILERVAPDDAVDAVKFHFDSLAHDNDASSSTTEETYPPSGVIAASPPAQPACTALVGTQLVAKFNKPPEQADHVKIFLAVWRVEGKNIDVVMSINVPVITGADGNQKGVGQEGVDWARTAWERARATLTIEDFGLFA
ncbi:hypothetical protein FRB94_014652 [Tulasnella sp. JGI-2019a]|nr:hypothetical protein FRB93_002459 [Tulasnella sp. JGI-2019a]KAG9007084.1 hypothetical protein FRB94_014652 [Tulasnella sp. JGI-2019a]KAG9033190.1 hypothetical protein FRB95_000445 [Tulasnella sp. JGI-2019a]